MNRIGPHFRGPDIDAIVDAADTSDQPCECHCGCMRVGIEGDMDVVDGECYLPGHYDLLQEAEACSKD